MLGPRLLLLVGLAWYLSSATALAYIDAAPTLGKLIKDSSHICVLEVGKVNAEKRAILFKKIADLKGKYPGEQINHQLTDGFPPREPRFILDWAEPGQVAVCFIHGNLSLICLGNHWYECHAGQAPWWTMTRSRPELSLAYCGSVDKLREHVAAIVAGKEVVITTFVHGANGLGMYFDVAFGDTLRGRNCQVQRLKASLQMPGDGWHIGKDPRWFVGFGPAGRDEIPALVKSLKHQEARVRGEAAADLGLLGKDAQDAVAGLRQLVAHDPEAIVRIRAAEALARIEPKSPVAVPGLIAVLEDKKGSVRKAAAETLGNIGTDAQGAVPALVKLLKDEDGGVQWKAAEALGLIGPAAEPAVAVLAELLKDTRLRNAAAEALGRIGPKAQVAVPALVEALKEKDERFRWSAIGALVRIRGPAAKAVVPLLIQELGSGEHRNYYNATLYLSALGPDAKDAIPELRKRNDDLAACALWSIDPENGIQGYILTSLTTDRTCDQWFAASHFQMMGPWRKDAARAVAEALLDGRLPQLAPWAVERILRGEADAAVPALVKGLKAKEPTRKVRAAKFLGEMGRQAHAAVPALNDVLKDQDAKVHQAAAEALKQIMVKEAK